MEYKQVLETVTKDIQDIEKLVSNFNNSSDIPTIELDLALSKLRNVYDVLLMFRENPGSMNHEIKQAKPVITPEKENPVPVKEKIPVIEHEIISGPLFTDESEAPSTEKKSPGTGKTSSKVGRIVGEKFSSDQAFINERIGKQTRKKDVSASHQSSPIKTITGSMGINDKFFFIRELFRGNSELFSQILEELDASPDYNSAYNLLTSKFEWDMESDPVQLLLNLVRRKFISSGNE
jgi:hypothetical protein